jgi:hypothetical protein
MTSKVRDFVEKNGLRLRVVQVGKFGQDELNSSS